MSQGTCNDAKPRTEQLIWVQNTDKFACQSAYIGLTFRLDHHCFESILVALFMYKGHTFSLKLLDNKVKGDHGGVRLFSRDF